MTEQPPGGPPQERLPEGSPEERLPATRPSSMPAPSDRFTAPPSAHRNDLTPERAARIVRQSASARWVGLIAVIIVSLFVIGYYFYELGLPGGISKSRLEAALEAEQVTSIERGYNIYQANCARCHGPNGEGGIGPTLNSQEKLFAHLNPDYIHSMLQVGGRFACGNPNSLMPVWANTGTPPGPLNYKQVEDVIAFIRAEQDQSYRVLDPGLFEPVVNPSTGQEETFKGWVDPSWTPAPGSTPFPACWKDAFLTPASPGASGVPGRLGSPAPSGSAPASEAPSASPAAVGLARGLRVPDGLRLARSLRQPGRLRLGPDRHGHRRERQGHRLHRSPRSPPPPTRRSRSSSTTRTPASPHNIQIKDASGAAVFSGATFPGVATQTYDVPALAAGSYPFMCTVHPNMTGTLTVGADAMAQTTLPATRPQPAPRKRVFFGLFDADGWSWASVKAIFWFVLMIMLLGYLPDRAYYFTVQQTVDLGLLALVADQLLPAVQRPPAVPGAGRRHAAVAAVAARDPAAGRSRRRRRGRGRPDVPVRRWHRRQGGGPGRLLRQGGR